MKIESYEITRKGGRKNRYAGSVRGKGRGYGGFGGCKKGARKGKEGRRRHVCCSMIYRLHCRHGDFCQPSFSIQSSPNSGATV